MKQMLKTGHCVLNLTALTDEVLEGLRDGEIGADDKSVDVLDPIRLRSRQHLA